MSKIIQDKINILTWPDKVILSGMLLTISSSIIFMGINQLTTKYTGINYIFPMLLINFPFFILLFYMSSIARNSNPRLANFGRAFFLVYMFSLTTLISCTGIQYTPFHYIDPNLVKLDKILFFDQMAWLNWTYANPIIKITSKVAYNSLVFELLIIPLIVGIYNDNKTLNIFATAMVISFIIGTTFYYFYPTIGPAGIFLNEHFTNVQLHTSEKFRNIHNYLPIQGGQGGMIAMPSFHIVWITLITYACKNIRWLLPPILLLNLLVLISTITLGWHYLVDVIAGLALASFSIYIGRLILDMKSIDKTLIKG